MVNLILLQAKESFANDFGSVPNKKEGHPDIFVQFFSWWFYFFGGKTKLMDDFVDECNTFLELKIRSCYIVVY
jgi:hypothetical protein